MPASTDFANPQASKESLCVFDALREVELPQNRVNSTSPDSPTTNFLLTDTLGSVVSSFNNLPNGAATVLGNQVYGPYGNRRVQQGTISTSKGYTGQFTDFVAGLDYYHARYYDPVVGVFVSADTVQGNMQGMNPYAYVGGNPETKTDPSGNMKYDAATGQVAIPQPNGSYEITGYNTGENGTFDSSVSSTSAVFNPSSFWSTSSGRTHQSSGGSASPHAASAHKRLSPDQLDQWCSEHIDCQNTLEAYYDGEDAQDTFNIMQWGLPFAALFSDGGIDPEEAQQILEEDTLRLEYGLGDGEFDSEIEAKLQSSDPAQVAEGQAAGIANKYSQLLKFNYKYGVNGSDGEVDAETPEAIIEAKSGRLRGQVMDLKGKMNNPYTNPDGKPFVIYGPGWGSQEAMTIYENLGSLDTGQNVYVVTSQVQLIEVLQYLQGP